MSDQKCAICEGGWGKYWNLVLGNAGSPRSYAFVCAEHTKQSRDAIMVSSGEGAAYTLMQAKLEK